MWPDLLRWPGVIGVTETVAFWERSTWIMMCDNDDGDIVAAAAVAKVQCHKIF